MKKTRYLTGHESDRYEELLIPLATLRINDMLQLQARLRSEASNVIMSDEIYISLVRRYTEIDEAIDFWRDLTNERN